MAQPLPVGVMPAESFLNSNVPFPEIRYRQYRWLSDQDREKVSEAGYITADDWDQPLSAVIEHIPFKDLGILQPKIAALGLSQEQWDCYINNYSGYKWDQLSSELQIHAVALGWTPTTWANRAISGNKPDVFRNFWDELSSPLKKTAGEFCYFENTWNQENLRYWTTAPPSERDTQAPTKAPTVAPTGLLRQTDAPLDASSSSSSASSICMDLLLFAGMTVALMVM
ncbi:MAG: hypothetical protein SGBAC_004166 [Bacillariaceae sp.]